MKKLLCVILCIVTVLTLCTSCSKAEAGVFSVGFGREKIQPTSSIPLAGYGNTSERMSQGALDILYTTCVAIRDANGETVLMFTNDVISSRTVFTPDLRAAITEATGIPDDKIMFSATHTHSGPDIISTVTTAHVYYTDIFKPAIVAAAKAALEDLTPATIQTGETQVEGLNFIRHYKLADGTYFGDNFGDRSNTTVVEATTEPDQQMQLIRFVREGDKKDVLMVNWQAHSKVASNGGTQFGRQTRPMISADYPGHCRTYVEANADVLFAYYLGASGNLNPADPYLKTHDVAIENIKTYSERLSGYMLDALDNMKEAPIPTIKTKQVQFQGTATDGQPKALEINAIVMGDISFVTVPYEMFDTNGMQVKEGSPTGTTFVLSCSNGGNGYMPAEYVWDYPTNDGRRPYEERSCNFVKGTGEQVAQELVSMLKELAG